MLCVWKLKLLQRMHGSLALLPPNKFAVFDGWYFVKHYIQRAKNCIDYLYKLFKTRSFKVEVTSCLERCLLCVILYANKMKWQWRQQRFVYKGFKSKPDSFFFSTAYYTLLALNYCDNTQFHSKLLRLWIKFCFEFSLSLNIKQNFSVCI